MQPIEFADLIESAQLVERTSGKTGNKYHMLVFKLEGDVEFQFLAMKGEDNAIKLLSAAAEAAAKKQ
jgi:hypothetical protein